MEKFWNPSKRFSQIVKRLARCTVTDKVDSTSDQFVLFELNENILGVYKGDKIFEDIIFTNEKIIFHDSKINNFMKVYYSELKEVNFPAPTSDSIVLNLLTKNLKEINLKVVGKQGNFRDVFQIGKFLMRVIEDNQKNA
jgi:hypothetical protein